MKLYPYQEIGRDFLVKNRLSFLADQPGLGKTAQTIAAAREFYGDTEDIFGSMPEPKIAVLCPKVAIENWRREFARWWPDARPFVTNYDQMITDGDDHNTWSTTTWDTVVLDEAHRLKTAEAKRSQKVYRHINAMNNRSGMVRVNCLSGTPAPNHAGELWTHLRVLRPDLILDRRGVPMTQDQFEHKYCKVFLDNWGRRKIGGSKERGVLKQMLFDNNFMLRRLKKDVQKDLPPLVFDEYPLTPRTKKHLQGFDAMGLTADNVLEALEMQSEHMAEWQHKVAELKIPMVLDYLENELDSPDEKIIVFFHHTVIGRELFHKLAAYQPVLIDGRTADAQQEVDEFQNNPKCRVALGQITACQEALNMQAATQVCFAEASWSPSANYQAASRAHRIGRVGGLIARYLSLPNSTDQIVQRVLVRKAEELTEIFD